MYKTPVLAVDFAKTLANSNSGEGEHMKKTIAKIESDDPVSHSVDVVAENIGHLKAMFPELVTESADGTAVNVDILKQLTGDKTVTDSDEKFGLSWHGKQKAQLFATTPSTGTLLPRPEESVDWDTTRNLIIEGNNIEVLKLPKKSYTEKIKLIYIDPPYNTGKDRIYPDNYQSSMTSYLQLTGQIEGGAVVSTNPETGGRFHTNWLNMMYPRLSAARELLQDEGLIIVSIDSWEVSNLRLIMDEIYGRENFIGLLPTVMNLKGNNDAFAFSDTHEFTVVYAKSRESCSVNELPVDEDGLDAWEEDERGLFKKADTLKRTGQDAARSHRPNGWFPVFITSDNRVYATEDNNALSPDDEALWPVNDSGEELSWTWSKAKINDEGYNLIVELGRNGKNIYKKQRPGLGDIPTGKPKSVLYKPEYSSSNGTAEVSALFGAKVFDNPPKPRALIRDFVILATDKDSLILDFFAGTGTTGHAVIAQNAADGGKRQYILVQLPEPLDPKNQGQKIAADFCDQLDKPRTIAEITKERMRRASKNVKQVTPSFAGDLGFRVFKLADSNIRSWNPDPNNLEQCLENSVEHLRTDRTEQDILYELMLKLGLDLCVPIDQKTISGKTVYCIGGGQLFACFAQKILAAEATSLAQGIVAWHEKGDSMRATETRCMFRDSAFENDVAKTNLCAVLNQYGIKNVRSL